MAPIAMATECLSPSLSFESLGGTSHTEGWACTKYDIMITYVIDEH